jgi:PAS domain S-box-containing protein
VNEGFTRATGWSEADLLGRSELELGLWAVPGERAAVVEALHARRPVEEHEVALRSRDGRTLAGLLTANPINLGGASCLVALFRDVSERTAARLAG